MTSNTLTPFTLSYFAIWTFCYDSNKVLNNIWYNIWSLHVAHCLQTSMLILKLPKR